MSSRSEHAKEFTAKLVANAASRARLHPALGHAFN